MPLTGFEPTMAMALAATVVKRKEMTATIRSPTRACQTLLTTPPKAKKAKMQMSAMTMPQTMVFIGRSSSVRSILPSAVPGFLRNSLTASEAALLMTPKDLMMPMTPAVAMPPMPICRA